MINYCEYLNLKGLSFKISFDTDNNAENDSKIILGVDYCEDPVLRDYWGNLEIFVGDL